MNDHPSGAPWILGARGAPREAPEHTLVGLRRALDLGADGVVADAREAAGGELVVFGDEVVDRTTDGSGRLADLGLVELSALDAGGWFAKRYTGEPIPTVEEWLEAGLEVAGGRGPLHWLRVHEPGAAEDLARRVARLEPRPQLRVASEDPHLLAEAADAGLPAVLLAPEADARALELAREVPLVAVAAPSWTGDAADRAWPCERWTLDADEPDAQLAAARGGVSGWTTREVAWAVAARDLAALAPDHAGGWPLDLPELPLEPDAHAEGGAWRGHWRVSGELRNPFPFGVRVVVSLAVRLGAFECEGLPAGAVELGPGASYELVFDLRGGSWSPGGDPCVAALFDWPADGERAAGRLLLDAPLARRRHAVADPITRRLSLLREGPREPEASMTLRRRGRELHVAVESAGGLAEPRAWVRVGRDEWFGGTGVRARLPEDFDRRRGGVDFACGVLGRGPDGRLRLRRFGGGLEWGADPGAPARLHSHLA